jgi:hypothetical protein
MRELLFHLRKALETAICSGTPPSSASTWRCFDWDRASIAVADRFRLDVDSGLASGQVLGTPTLFIDGVSTAPATTRLPCWPRWPGKPPCSHAVAE